MKFIQQAGEVRGKKVLLRIDLNVPVVNGKVINGFRIDKSLETITYLREQGARIILISHFKGKEGDSLRPVSEYLQHLVPHTFVEDFYSDLCRETVQAMKNGDVTLFENLRMWDGEEKNDTAFSQHLASFADMYCNDAFSVSHRAHSSIVGVPGIIPGYAGVQLKKEVERLSEAFHPKRPFLFILGGAKFDTKMPLVQKFISKADTVFVGGALANDVFKAQGKEIGRSVITDHSIDLSFVLESEKVVLPTDVIVRNESGEAQTKNLNDVLRGDMIMDAGPLCVSDLSEKISQSAFVLWNGPLGNYEEGFHQSTLDLARVLGASGVESIVGGGDTIAAIEELDNFNEFSFVSTSGGAMLDFLAQETLPGIQALEGTSGI